ncbi:uncharacterized protein N7459_008585 [Penicillium hispanicum]|uniref:uncharacterized protein n=1 Tax=Penicillium hispanicum TaxID=1080232 RepID=UPI0025418E97|nr:uncharacterized protein N7459_008585 [Penicillium hispanicum]KAJ5574158.1 hypothetical protein N7459_008585 [Penicillium hispanicum]
MHHECDVGDTEASIRSLREGEGPCEQYNPRSQHPPMIGFPRFSLLDRGFAGRSSQERNWLSFEETHRTALSRLERQARVVGWGHRGPPSAREIRRQLAGIAAETLADCPIETDRPQLMRTATRNHGHGRYRKLCVGAVFAFPPPRLHSDRTRKEAVLHVFTPMDRALLNEATFTTIT